MGIRKSKIEGFITRGAAIKQKEYHTPERGLAMPSYIAGPLYDQWMSEIEIFADKNLKNHSLRDSIHTAFFHRNNSYSAYSNMIGYLNALLADDELFDKEVSVQNKVNKGVSILTPDKKKFVQEYIDKIEEAMEDLNKSEPEYSKQAENELINLIIQTKNVFKKELPEIEDAILLQSGTIQLDANTVIGILNLYLINNETYDRIFPSPKINKPIIFLSHKSNDKKYADALEKLIMGLGVKHNQLIYTSHALHKIPLDRNIYDYLRDAIGGNVFVIILWSNSYINSPGCLNEMGAAWVAQKDYTNIYTSDFDFGNPKYHECAVDTRKMGAVLNGDDNCKASMIELKNKIISLFSLNMDETTSTYLIDQFIKEIKL